MKRFFTRFFFLVAMIAFVTGVKAYVRGDRVTIDEITYQVASVSDDAVKVQVMGSTKTGELVIPAKVFDGKDVTFTVTEIGDGNGTSFNSGITAITLPETMEVLNYASFRNTSITKIHFPKNLRSFSYTNGWTMPSEFAEITVDPENTTYEAEDGILYTKGKKALVYVPRAKVVDETFVVDPAVEEIRAQAFAYQKYVKKVVIGKNVKNVQIIVDNNYRRYIDNGSKITYFEVDPENATYCSIDGVIFSKDKTKLVRYPEAKPDETYTVPEGVTTIGNMAFYNAKFKELDLGHAETLGNTAINAQNLTTIHIPAEMTKIPEGSIAGNKIQNIFVKEGNPEYKDTDGVLFTADSKTLLAYPVGRTKPKEYTVPETTETIAARAFQNAKFTSIVLNEGLKTIGMFAFDNTKLSTITIPTTVTYIGERAFAWVPLTEIKFTEESSLTSLGAYIFFQNDKMKSITLPKSLTNTAAGSLGYCHALEEVIIPDGSQLKAISNDFVAYDNNLKRVVFEGSCDNLTVIGSEAFADLTSLEYINLPKSITDINARAFFNCKNLKTVEFAEDAVIETISTGAFADCGIEKITIPGKVKNIYAEAFRNCDVLETVSLPASTTFVSPTAFKGCLSLKQFIVDENNERYSSVQGYLCSKDKSTLELFPPGMAREDFTLLPPSLTKIGDNAFYECGEKFTNICIPAKVEQIGKRAFGLDASLQSIAFLGDELIDPDKIAQGENQMAIDNGTQAQDMFQNITIYVRKEVYQDYVQNHKGKGDKYDTYYSQFKDMKTSFYAQRTTDDGQDELLPMSNTAANLLGTRSTAKVYIVPEKVTNTEDGVTYAVNLIGDYAFENASENIKEVVVKSKVGYIGSMAFVTKTETVEGKVKPVSSTIEQVVFTANEPAEWMSRQYFGLSEEFKEFLPSQKIYVKKSKCDAYKTEWVDFTNQIDYKIPGISISNTFGTFSREFDVDLGDVDDEAGTKKWWDNAKNCPKVIAFTAGEDHINGNDTDTKWVTMRSINEGAEKEKDGLYVPAFTGVLLKAIDGKTPEDFYYRIGEEDVNEYKGANVMKDVTVNEKTISQKEGNNTNFIISSGQLWKVTSEKAMPLHKSYMQLNVPAGAKVMMRFSDGSTTGINAIKQPESENEDVYDLQGRRVMDPQKGIYIKNGKKIVVR